MDLTHSPDVLGQILERSRLRGQLYCRTVARAPWELRFPARPTVSISSPSVSVTARSLPSTEPFTASWERRPARTGGCTLRLKNIEWGNRVTLEVER